jgi:hypothetical protein
MAFSTVALARQPERASRFLGVYVGANCWPQSRPHEKSGFTRHPRVAEGDDGEAIAGGDPVKCNWGKKTPLSFSQRFLFNFWLAWIPSVFPRI